MTYFGGYTLDLYCNKCNGDKYEYSEMADGKARLISQITANGIKAYSIAMGMAKNRGWKLTKNGDAICPRCNPKSSQHTK